MSGGGTQQSLRKYLGAIKDSTTVGLAKVNSDYKELDIAIVRATNHVEHPAKEKHIKAIFFAISASRPRADVAYSIHALARRLSKTHNWAVALKTLIVVHRALREVDPTFREELINYGRTKSHMLNLSHFKDDSSAYAWDYSAWVRTYALYLEERLECSHVLKYDVETGPVKTRELDTVELLVQLPALQQLLIRLINCQPQGAAVYNLVIRLALTMVAAESSKIYNAISDGIINLVDKFFDMQRHDAVKVLDIYKRACQQSEMLTRFYEVCRSIDIGRREGFIKIEQPPASFLTTMEEYVREAPLALTVRKDQVKEEKTDSNVVSAIEYKKVPEEQEAPPPQPPPPPPPPPESVELKATLAASDKTDLLGLHETFPDASELENKNALAFTIVPVDFPLTNSPSASSAMERGATGWELALVSVSSSNETIAAETKLGGGLDMLTLDSLYDDAIRRANQPTSYNPWDPQPTDSNQMQQSLPFNDPFFASNAVAAPLSVQMAVMAHQQQQLIMMSTMNQPVSNLYANPFTNSFANPYASSTQQPYGLSVPIQSSNAYVGLM
ncbi:Putative clathrin assembly protein [Apostasia shenzhenica]|uniref:Clathrin assembly protein n=1 Tax=Apostasia shenzhenica TaxID=1088818 RepID=A0A2I0AQW1_9ASPA|nr:Putative clathrin assembly protein [Apostasia shenzhenica]